MKKLIFVLNDHAEVGKTSVAAALRGYLRDQEGFDTHLVSIVVGDDPDRDAAPRIHDEIKDLAGVKKADWLYKMVAKHDVTICDVESGNASVLVDLYHRNDLELELSDHDIDLTIVTPEVEEAECHEEMCNISSALSGHADYIVARIPHDQFNSPLEAWEESDAFDELAYLGAIVVEFPRLTDKIQDRLEEAELEIPEAMAADLEALPEEISIMIADWRRRFRVEIEHAADYLYPARSRRGLPMAASA
ncbi:MAG: hypothetical protein ACI8UO_006744 [Verrucomicrobiales bacterium]|jgi:hypothetical protein